MMFSVRAIGQGKVGKPLQRSMTLPPAGSTLVGAGLAFRFMGRTREQSSELFTGFGYVFPSCTSFRAVSLQARRGLRAPVWAPDSPADARRAR